jgi:hypothetical protein
MSGSRSLSAEALAKAGSRDGRKFFQALEKV